MPKSAQKEWIIINAEIFDFELSPEVSVKLISCMKSSVLAMILVIWIFEVYET